MYCINCGVELMDSEKKCPLCGTVVFHPELKQGPGEGQYPPEPKRGDVHADRSALLFVLTVLFALPIVVSLLVDWQVNGRIIWAGYVAGGLLLCYIVAVLPLWFRRPNPVIFAPANFAAMALYVLYIAYETGGGWYLSFALPAIVGAALICCATITLLRYLRQAYLFIFGGAFIASGLYMVLVEKLINYSFHLSDGFLWAFYPLAACVILGGMLIVVGANPALKEALRKRFFI